jgi:hypothetical protein
VITSTTIAVIKDRERILSERLDAIEFLAALLHDSLRRRGRRRRPGLLSPPSCGAAAVCPGEGE